MDHEIKEENAPVPPKPVPAGNGQVAQAVPAQPPKRSRRPFLILGAVVVAVAGAVGIYALLTAGEEDTDDAQVAADMVPVGTRVAGQVTHVFVRENQLVRKDQVIASLDDADYVARANQAQAELETANAQAAVAAAQVTVVDATSRGGLASAQAMVSGSSVGVGSAEAQLASAQAGLQRAESDARKTDLDLARAKELRAANAVPQERLDNAQAASDSAHAALAQARASVAMASESKRAAEARVGEMRGRLSQSTPVEAQRKAASAASDLAKARVRSAEAQLALANNQVKYTKILAPADGLASKLSVHEGQLVAIGQPVVELVPLATYLIGNFKETQVGRMKAGQRAQIKVDAYPGQRFAGEVESLSGGTGASFSLLPADNASGNFVKVVQRVPVRIKWAETPTVLLLPGMSADVTVHVER